MITYVYPKNVLTETEKNVKNLIKKQPLQIGLGERKTTIFNENEYIILDFGKEHCGGVRIFTYRGGDIPVRIRFGESLTEASSELGGKTNATNNHSLRDFTVNLQSYSDMTFGQTGFRYVRIDFYGRVAVVCGSGNNAGDGYVAARVLYEKGIDLTIFLTSDKFSPD